MSEIEPIQSSTVVAVSTQETFDFFTAGFNKWWPAEFTWSQPDLSQSSDIEPKLHGMLFETGPHEFRIDWGRIIAWDPPSSFSFLWQISATRVPVPNPDHASIVTVTFSSAEGGTRVAVTHDAWARHGNGAPAYRDDFTQAWPMALTRLRETTDKLIAKNNG